MWRNVAACCGVTARTRAASSTFVAFTPWTTAESYLEFLHTIDRLDLVEAVAPIQFAIRLLVTSGSPLLELSDIRDVVSAFDPASLTWPWRHADPRVDLLQAEVMKLVMTASGAPRGALFDAISSLARGAAGLPTRSSRPPSTMPVPYVSEPWYCCAEPMEAV